MNHLLSGSALCMRSAAPRCFSLLLCSAAGFNDFPWSYSRLSINRDVLPTRYIGGQGRAGQSARISLGGVST
jgi:hypothetical protein